jgi:hypothetical protein
MKTKIMAVVLVVTFGWSCAIMTPTSLKGLQGRSANKTILIETKAGAKVELHDVVVSENKIEGLKKDDTKFEIAEADIRSVQIKKMDFVTPFLFCGAIILIGVLAVSGNNDPPPTPIPYGSMGSCPFIYSYDGTRYVFDADPIGGAICRSMERTEWAELDHLSEVDGRYRLLVANELEESDFLDEISLVIVDHPADVRVVPDVSGGLHSIVRPLAAFRASDQNGRDLRPLIASEDDRFWESEKDGRDLEKNEDLKDTLIFEFPKPVTARKATLVANVWTTLWGMQAGEGLLGLFGESLPGWYAEVNRGGPASQELWNWYFTGGMYTAKILVETRDGWTPKGLLYGGGPFNSKDKAYTLDVSDVPGEKLKIKLELAAGFWKLNYLAMDYSQETPVRVTEIRPEMALDRNGRDVKAMIAKADQLFFEMPQAGEFAELMFTAPEKTAGLERTVLLKARGYYEVHFAPAGAGQPDLARQMLRDPNRAARYALESYYKTQKSASKVQ